LLGDYWLAELKHNKLSIKFYTVSRADARNLTFQVSFGYRVGKKTANTPLFQSDGVNINNKIKQWFYWYVKVIINNGM